MDQKQVAYLVPTTVLANQQYKAFKQRMDNYPIRVEVLNRFVNKKRGERQCITILPRSKGSPDMCTEMRTTSSSREWTDTIRLSWRPTTR